MTEQELIAGLQDPWWRLSHLYWIVDERGRPIPFEPNEEQKALYDSLWYRNVILKARQLGFSTLIQMFALDQALFNANYTAGVIADTLPNAMRMFRKVSFAYDRLPDVIKEMKPLRTGRDQMAKTEVEFANGSMISVGTSFRGGTAQLLHVSEMGKIAAKYPEKASEIVTGAFPAVHDGIIVVESTAEGNGGAFYDLSTEAQRETLEAPGGRLSRLTFRFHFFPWYLKKSYRVDPAHVVITPALQDYFRKLEATIPGLRLDPWQRAWYAATAKILKRKMKREHPSTPTEAFEVAIEGAIYGEEMTTLREQGRICDVGVDLNEPVNTFWDLGANDATSIWFHQRIGQRNHWIRYVESSFKGLGKWKRELEDWRADLGVRWGKHYLPHDADTVIQGEAIETKHQILTSGDPETALRNTVIVPRIASLDTGIELTRDALPRDNWFDRTECADGIRALDSYQYLWDEKRSQWSEEPYHNWASHGADAWRQFAQGYTPPGNAPERIQRFKSRRRTPF